MSDCPRCLAFTTDDPAYCAVCNRPRILESLRAPMIPPKWLLPLQQILVGMLCGWLAITLGVAFLREAKAVRDARQLLIEKRPQEAWELLGPFLRDHPDHKQGLLLGGRAAIRLDHGADAKKYFDTLTGLSPELGKELGNDYRQVLTEKVRTIACNATGFSRLLEESQSLGDSFPVSVVDGLYRFVETCRKNGNDQVPLQISYQLAQKGQEIDMLGKGYIPAISRALQLARYNDAKILAQYAVQGAPARIGEVKKILDAERAKVAVTRGTLDNLCHSLKDDSRFHTGGTWCFPATAPVSVQAARDGWGRPFAYTASAAASGGGCHSNVSLSSYGAAGLPTQERFTPAGGITCTLISGVQSWQLPSRYWQSPAEGEFGERDGD